MSRVPRPCTADECPEGRIQHLCHPCGADVGWELPGERAWKLLDPPHLSFAVHIGAALARFSSRVFGSARFFGPAASVPAPFVRDWSRPMGMCRRTFRVVGSARVGAWSAAASGQTDPRSWRHGVDLDRMTLQHPRSAAPRRDVRARGARTARPWRMGRPQGRTNHTRCLGDRSTRAAKPESGVELVIYWWSSPASIRGPSAFQADALPTELLDRRGATAVLRTAALRSRRDLNPRPPA